MPRPVPVSHTAPVYPGEPSLAWTASLNKHMWVNRFDVLYPSALAGKVRPLGTDFDGTLKADLEGLDERGQRARCLEVFEQILGVLADAGVRHREHPTFEIGGHVDHGGVFLDCVQATPDCLIPQCTAEFRLWLKTS